MANEELAKSVSSAPSIEPRGKRRADRDLKKNEPQIGQALRSVYDQTVDEAIPNDLLELLGRLG